MGLPWPLFVCLFHYFQANNTIFTTNKCVKCPSSYWDSNPQSSDDESPPITTKPAQLIKN